MKKNLLLAGMLCISAIAFGQTKTVEMGTGAAGTLSTKIEAAEYATLTDLTITGEIDARDFKFMHNNLSALAKLNMEAVDIAQYKEDGEEGEDNYAQYIPDEAFSNIATLTEVVFPKNLLGIKYSAFANTSLKKLDLSQTKLEKIDSGSNFWSCQELETVILPSTVIYIADYAFGNTPKLKSFTFLAQDPAAIKEGINGLFGYNGEVSVTASCILFVPVGTVEAYRAYKAQYDKETIGTIFPNIQEIGSVVKTDPTVSFTEAAVTKKDTDTKFTNALVNPDGVEVAYSSSDEAVATVDAATGEVTILKEGTTTITATTVETEAFNSIQVSYVLTVQKGLGIDNVTSSASIEMVSDGIQLQFEGAANIEVYTVNGVMIEKIAATNNCHISLNRGMYLVKINNDLHKVVR